MGKTQPVPKPSVPPTLELIRVAAGPGFVLAGFGMIPASFWWGVCLVYLGIVVGLAEAMWDPWLLKKRGAIQVPIIGSVFAFATFFTISVVLANAPIAIVVYLGGSENYAPGTQIGGIEWNPKFTDVRVALNEPSMDDYQSLNIVISPDTWTHEAAILNGPKDCSLSPEPGDAILAGWTKKGGDDTVVGNNVFGTFNFHDSLGTELPPMAIRNGYRLSCNSFQAHSTIQLVFASVTLNNEFLKPLQQPNPKQGQWGFSVGEFAPGSAKYSIWDIFGSRPHPTIVSLVGSYRNGPRTYLINKTIKIPTER